MQVLQEFALKLYVACFRGSPYEPAQIACCERKCELNQMHGLAAMEAPVADADVCRCFSTSEQRLQMPWDASTVPIVLGTAEFPFAGI
jgi:hypothetical protein